MSKLGFHVNQLHGGMEEVLAGAPLVVTVSRDAWWNEFAARHPATPVVVRAFETDAANPDFNHAAALPDPLRAAHELMAEAHRRTAHLAPGLVRQLLNEPPIESAAAMQRLALFEAECLAIAHGFGWRLAIGNFAVGNPPGPADDPALSEAEGPLSIWDAYHAALAAGRRYGALLNLHAYNWPDLHTADDGWYTLRYRLIYRRLPAHLHLPCILGEAGLDRFAARDPADRRAGGWNGHVSPADYLRQLRRFDRELARDPCVVGAALFCCGNLSPQWLSYDLWPDLARQIAADRPVASPPEEAGCSPGAASLPALPPSWVDLRGRLPLHPGLTYPTRAPGRLERIVVHHTATAWGPALERVEGPALERSEGPAPDTKPGAALADHAARIARYHVEQKGWPGIGYHLLVGPVAGPERGESGGVCLCHDLATVSNHVAGHNTASVGLALCGTFTRDRPPPAAQLAAARQAIAWIRDQVGRDLPLVAHRDLNPTACPGFDLSLLSPATPDGPPAVSAVRHRHDPTLPEAASFLEGRNHPWPPSDR